MTAAMLPHTGGCQGPSVRFPWYIDITTSNTVEAQLMKTLLCDLKDQFTDRRLKGRRCSRSTVLQKIKQFVSLQQLEQWVTDNLRGIKPQWLSQNVRFSYADKEFNCVFAYASCLHDKISTVDGVTARQIDKFMESWLVRNFCSNLMVTKYNFPVTLYYPQMHDIGFHQVQDQLCLLKSVPLQSRSVIEFVDSIRGDLFSEVTEAFRNYIQDSTRLKYYEKRKVTKELNQTNRVISQLDGTDVVVPDVLLQQQQRCQQLLGNRTGLQITEQMMNCLRQVYETKMIPLVTQACQEDLEKTLECYNMQQYDPKLSWSMMFRQFMYYIRDKKLLQNGRVALFDTIWLSDEAELSFMLTAFYLSKQLLRRPQPGELKRDYGNLLLFGESGTGKTYTLEALSLLMRVCLVSAPTLQSLFSGKPCFGERSMANCTSLVAHEVQLSSFLQSDAKEYLDLSLQERKVNVKYSQPVSISQGVPFLMATNDFMGDINKFWEQPKPYSGSLQRVTLQDCASPVLRRLTMIPFFHQENDWLTNKSYVRDFSLVATEVPPLDPHLPYVLSLMGAALMLCARVNDFLQQPEDVYAYAQFQQQFEKTFIGLRLKYMPEKQLQSLHNLYDGYCTLTKDTAGVYQNKQLFQQRFSVAAQRWQQHQASFSSLKTEFLAEYKRLHSKFIASDTPSYRHFRIGYSQDSYQAVLLKAYSVVMFKTHRMCRKNHLVTSRDYLAVVQLMNTVQPSIPKEIVMDTNFEGRRTYRPLPQKDLTYGAYDKRLAAPIIEFFVSAVDDQVKEIDLKDYDTDSSADDTDKLVIVQKKRFMNTAYTDKGQESFRRKPLQHIDSRAVPEGTEVIGVGANKRSRRLFQIQQASSVKPVFFYNSDDQSGQNERLLKRIEERNPLQVRAVPLCRQCKLVKQSVKQSYKVLTQLGQRRQMNRPLPRCGENSQGLQSQSFAELHSNWPVLQ